MGAGSHIAQHTPHAESIGVQCESTEWQFLMFIWLTRHLQPAISHVSGYWAPQTCGDGGLSLRDWKDSYAVRVSADSMKYRKRLKEKQRGRDGEIMRRKWES